MRIARLIPPLGLVLAIAACQAAPPTVTPTPSPSPSGVGASPADAASPSSSPTMVPSSPANVAKVQVSGKIYDDEGHQVSDATVEMRGTDGAVLRTTQAIGGAYAFPEVPVDTTLVLRVSKAGYTVRERKLTTSLGSEIEDRDPNVQDFGGSGLGAYYALSGYPEITSVTPANQQTGVTAEPLEVTFRLSQPLPEADRNRFGNLLELRFQVPSNVDPSGQIVVKVGTSYQDQIASLTWNEAGDVGTFRFGAPLVTRSADASAVTIGFNQEASLDNWPKDVNNRRLGRDRVNNTHAGNNTSVNGQVAPFWYPSGAEGHQAPTTRPSPLTIWAATHATTSVFSLKPDTKAPKLKEVVGLRGTAGANDRILVVFDEPMRGYPESALDGSAVLPSNYRFVLGRTDTSDDEETFKAADPSKGGNSPPLGPEYSASRPDTIVLPLPNGTLTNYSVIKLYVDPGVHDPAGNSVQSSTPDPTTGLADNLLLGNIQ